MIAGIVVGSMIIYTVGVLTGVYVGYSIRKHTESRPQKTAPTKADRRKILNLLKEQGRVTNNDVQALLNIGDSTATRYLERLENSGDIIQQGKTGRNVFYILK